MSPAIACPRCGSSEVEFRNYGRKAGGVVGTIAGAAGSVATAAEAGGAGLTVKRVAGLVLAGLAGGTAGCKAGAGMGSALDENVLDNCRCVCCGRVFGQRRRPNTRRS